jgi:dCTP deaminase
MLLSDRDITAAIAEGRLGIDPYDAGLVQPSSIDVRLDRFFRVFNNARYTHIDPALQQDDLTTLVEPEGDEPFVLHPGEFVLGSTLEVVTIPDDLAARLEGKSSLGRLGCSPTRRPASSTRASPATSRWSCPTWRTCRSRCGPA